MIDFGKRMSERWRDLRKKMEKHYSRVSEMIMKWWRTSEEMMMEKCLMKMKCMGISLNGWFGHKNWWKRKKLEVKMDGWFTVLDERKNKCRKITSEEEETKKIHPTRDQEASRRWLSIYTIDAFWLVSINSVTIFVIPKHLKSQFNAWFMILNIQKMINSN